MGVWTFASNRQGWGSDDGIWSGTEGHPPGCINGEQSVSGLSISVTPASPCSFWCKIVWDSTDELENPVDIEVSLSSNDGLVSIEDARSISTLPYDSGWFKVAGYAYGTGTVTSLGITISESMSDWPGTVWIDSIYVDETEPGAYDLTHSAGGMPGAVKV